MRSSCSSLLVLALALGARAYSSRRSALTDCLYGADVPTVLTSSPDWTALTRPYNLRIAVAPAVVAVPANVAQVRARARSPPAQC